MSISAKLVMELRAKTGAGMMDCKKALIETNGDLQIAIDYLREKGISKAAKKAARVASEGLVFISVSNDSKTGAMLELNSETDFVAKNEDFINFGNKLVDIILTNDISTVDELKNLEINGSKINDQLASLIATIGENMNIRRFRKAVSNSFVTTYIHMGGKIGVLLNMEGENNEDNKTKAKDIAMHVAAMAPDFMERTDVPEEVLEKEKTIVRAQLLEQGKPENIIDKILIGKMNKYYEENCLLQQKFVKDDKLTVAQYADKLKIVFFDRFKLGEGIEKKEEDFASEVAAQIKS